MARGKKKPEQPEKAERLGFTGLRTAFVVVGLLASIPLFLALVYFSNQQRSHALAEAHEHLEILTAAYATSSDAVGDLLTGPLGAELFDHAQFIAFVLDDGDRLVEAQPPALQSELSADEISILEIGTASDEPFFHRVGGEEFLFARTATANGSLIFVGLPASPIFAAAEEEIRRQTLILVAVFLTSVVIGLFGSEVLIFGPLTSLSHTAQALRSGDFSARSRTRGVGEVGQLAKAIDQLAASVQDRQTRLERARAQAEQAKRVADIANSAKSDFLASMSHEIRTPLHSIVGHTELLLEGFLVPQQRRHAIQIEAGARAVLDIVNDVLDLSVIEAGKIKVQRHPLVLGELVENAVSIVKHFAERKGLHLSAEVDPELPAQVVGDESRIRQVLLNLLNNAVKFTSAGTVTLCVRRPEPTQDDTIEFVVTDTGTGIPIEEQHRLFQRFSQIGPIHIHGGTGLGLSISKRLVEEMGGTVGFRSEPDRGATFWARIPLPANPKASAQIPTQVGRTGDQLRILIADDVAMNIEIARAALETAGHMIEIAEDGNQAVSLAHRRKYDVILMDVQMSPLDGLAASSKIRTEPGPNSDTPIIAMTANVLPDQIERYRSAGMNDYIGKPFRRVELLDKLKSIAGGLSASAFVPSETRAKQDFDRSAFDELAALLNERQLSSWLERVQQQIGLLLAEQKNDQPDRTELARLCHGIVSQAGSLGFVRLAEACRELEEACLEPESDIGPSCAAARSAAEMALENLPC